MPGGLSREWILDDESARELSQSVVGPTRRSSSPAWDEHRPASPFLNKPSDTKEGSQSTTPTTSVENPARMEPFTRAKFALLIAISLAVGIGTYALGRNHSAGNTTGQQPKTTGSASQGSDGPPSSEIGSSASLNSPDSFSLAPTVAVIQCKLGETISRSLTFYNPSASELTFEAVTQDVVLREGKVSFARAGALLNGIAATAVFSERFFNVKPRETRSISVSLTVHPRTTSQGVLVQFRGTDKVPLSKTIGVTPTLGTLVLINLSDGSPTEAGPGAPGVATSLSSFTVSQWAERSNGEAGEPGNGDSGTANSSATMEKGGSQP